MIAAGKLTPGWSVVIQPYAGGGPEGHFVMYTGAQWVSDFVQRDMWGGDGYRTKHPSFTAYRPKAACVWR